MIEGAKWSNGHSEYMIGIEDWEPGDEEICLAIIHAHKDGLKIARQMAAAPRLLDALKRLTRIASVELTNERWSSAVSQAIAALSLAQSGTTGDEE